MWQVGAALLASGMALNSKTLTLVTFGPPYTPEKDEYG